MHYLLAVRIPDPTDRRATLIQLTLLAQSNMSEVLRIQAEIAENLFGDFAPEKRKQFYSLLLQRIENKDISNPCVPDFKF